MEQAADLNGHINWPPAARYVLAVSGGADSMALLDLMAGAAQARGYELVVAHFDHGLRPDSATDAQFVAAAARRYGLPLAHHAANLGRGSEAEARRARHGWLEQTRAARQAAAVITAHHQDDLIETSLLNLARGTGPRGLAPMQSGPILRPLLAVTRAQLRAYAAARDITWREDPTNADIANPRNFLRHRLLPAATPDWRARYLENLARLAQLNTNIAQNLGPTLEAHRAAHNRYSFPRELIRDLSLPELQELLSAAARALDPAVELDSRTVAEVALFAKTARPHRRRPLRKHILVVVEPEVVSVYYMGTTDMRRQ